MPKIEKAPWIEQKFDPRSLKIPPPHFVASGRLEGLKICLHLKKSCASEPVRHKSSSERTYLRRGGGFGRRIRAVCAAAVGAAARLLCVCFACGVGAVCCSVSAVIAACPACGMGGVCFACSGGSVCGVVSAGVAACPVYSAAASVSVALMVLHVYRCGSFGDNARRLCLLTAVLLARCVLQLGYVMW